MTEKQILKDADIREPLFEYLEETYGKVRILEEKNMGRSRADVVMVLTDCLVGIEIKSDADSYTRLKRQVKDYDIYYDKNVVVVGSTHAAHIAEYVPAHWGILSAEQIEGQMDFYWIRTPKDNPNAKLEKKLRFLWRMELTQLQEFFDMPRYKEKSKDFVIKSIVDRTGYPEDKKGYIATEMLHNHISEILFERDYNTVQERILEYKKEQQKNKTVATKPKKRRRRRKKMA